MTVGTSRTYTCPVCGYSYLHEPPRSASGGRSYEICPSCGFQFGVTDDDRLISYEQWRRSWADQGMPWHAKAVSAPPGWDPVRQLRSVTGSSDDSHGAPGS